MVREMVTIASRSRCSTKGILGTLGKIFEATCLPFNLILQMYAHLNEFMTYLIFAADLIRALNYYCDVKMILTLQSFYSYTS